MSVQFEIEAGKGPDLERIAQAVRNREGLLKVLGQTGANLTRQNFRRKQQEGNKFGAPSTGFYQKAANATSWRLGPRGSVSVAVNQRGVALRYFGGTVTPVRRRYLTIPANAAAYGKSAGDIPGLFVVKLGSSLALAREDATDPDGLEVFFWLRKSTKHNPDRSVLPAAEDFRRNLSTTALRFYEREIARAAQQ